MVGPILEERTIPLSHVDQRWLTLDGEGPLRDQICRAIRSQIREGTLRGGARLPSTRLLAEDLGVSRSTTSEAYEQLLAEGYLEARRGSGTFVASGIPGHSAISSEAPTRAPRPVPPRPPASALARRLAAANIRYPFDALAERPPAQLELLYGLPDPNLVPLDTWGRLVGRCARAPAIQALAYAPPEGLPALRRVIAAHISRTRGVRATPERVIICAGFQQALTLVVRLLADPGDPVVIEEPCYPVAVASFLAEGLSPVCVPVDAQGLVVSQIPAVPARLAYVTPSHQFPLGAVLSLSRRAALLDWARGQDAYVLEDDYDGEFRYAGRPIESLQGLDADGRVIYVGTFSKTLFPALRVGYAVVPESLVEPLRTLKWLADWSVPTLIQQALAELIDEGHFARVLRRQRARYARRREVLVDALARRLGGAARIEGDNAGLHLVCWLRDVPAVDAGAVVARARQRGVGVYPIADHYLTRQPDTAGLLLGYTLLDEAALAEAVRRLAGVLGKQSRKQLKT